jgi:hypothetical protein
VKEQIKPFFFVVQAEIKQVFISKGNFSVSDKVFQIMIKVDQYAAKETPQGGGPGMQSHLAAYGNPCGCNNMISRSHERHSV